MSQPARCDECRAIIEEIRKARRESSVSSQRREELQVNISAVQAILAGTGEGVDELLAMPAAVRRMLEHEVRSGQEATDQFQK